MGSANLDIDDSSMTSNPKGGAPGRGCEQAERDQRCVLPPPYTDAGSC